MSTDRTRYLFYSYWDSYGDGIPVSYLSILSDSLIFDTYNRSLYAYNGVIGNHYIGSYHGEIFNDFDNNHPTGDYSSVHGSHVDAVNPYEFGIGYYNESKPGETLFTVGTGYIDEESGEPVRSNALEVHNNGYTYVKSLHTTLAYFDDNEVTGEKANIWLAGRNVRRSIDHMVRMYPITDDRREGDGFYNGIHYIWTGCAIDLPPEDERYSNVIYIVLDEAPSTSLPAFLDDDWDDVMWADMPAGAGNYMILADDGNPEAGETLVLRYD